MRKKYLVYVVSIVMSLVLMWGMSIDANAVDGEGTNSNPYLVNANLQQGDIINLSEGHNYIKNDTESHYYVNNSGHTFYLTTGSTANFDTEFSRQIKQIKYLRTENSTLYFEIAEVGITVVDSEHGSVTASSLTGAPEEEITLTINPDSGYHLDALTVKTYSGEEVTVTDNKFNLPGTEGWKGGVTVEATFIENNPSPEPAPSPEPEQPKTVQQQEEEPVEVPFNPVIVSTDKTEFNNENANVIPGDTYNFSRCIMTDEAVKGINKILEKNPAQKNITIYSGKAITFNKEFLDNIRAKNITLTYYFMHQGHLYSVTVDGNVNAEQVLGKAKYEGPLYVGKVLGTTRLIK